MKQIKLFKIIIAIVLLISSIVLLAITLLNTQSIQIVLETGQEITTQNSNYFTLTNVLVLISASFLIGASSIYLYYNSEEEKIFSVLRSKKIIEGAEKYDAILPLLKEDEKKVILALKENNGEILQNKLVVKLGLSKVKITRLIFNLEQKNLVIKERYGLTNKIKFIK